jgi:primosomal protein N' (replication factor Y)
MSAKGDITNFYEISPLLHGGLAEFTFTYSGNAGITPGMFVTIPFGRRSSLGIITKKVNEPDFTTKPISEIHDNLPLLQNETLELAAWIHQYYLASPQSVWQTLLPAGLTKKARATKLRKKSTFKAPTNQDTLTDEQSAALAKLRANTNGSFLLEGITGSGKTRLYIERVRDMLAEGKSTIVLVPEISLTPQLVSQFEQTFGEAVVSQHSRMTPAQRRNIWLGVVASEEPQVLIGPRSTLFLPAHNLGLIIIDEEHDGSYKQGSAPRYNAITTASKLAGLTTSQLILGSATPGLQEVFLARERRLELIKLTKRASGQPLPTTHIIDLRDKSLLRRSRFISQPLLEALEHTLASGRQSLLFINRRGSASSYQCGDCGEVRGCPTCHIPLTFHADHVQLICHYCNYHEKPSATCPECGGSTMNFLGGGTKRIEAEITKLLPSARIARLDKDNGTLEHIEDIHTKMHNGDIDILIGTQMITKGLDISGLDTVGVISADTALHFPDFSAAERTFQIISQVIGRAGRTHQPGLAFIQTYTPDHPAIVAAAGHNFDSFAEVELAERHLLNYPPYVYLLKIHCSLKTASAVKHKAQVAFDLLKVQPGIQILGPAPAFAERLHGDYHWQLIVKSKSRARLVEVAKLLPAGWTIDLDPLNLL